MSATPDPLSAKRLMQILHAVADGITVQDRAGHLVFVNEAAARFFGLQSPEQAMKLGGAKIIEGFKMYDEQQRELSVMDLPGRRTLQGVAEPTMIIGFTTPTQSELHWSSVKSLPIHDAHGQVEYAVNVFQDVTPLKGAELRLRMANDRITHLLEATLKVT